MGHVKEVESIKIGIPIVLDIEILKTDLEVTDYEDFKKNCLSNNTYALQAFLENWDLQTHYQDLVKQIKKENIKVEVGTTKVEYPTDGILIGKASENLLNYLLKNDYLWKATDYKKSGYHFDMTKVIAWDNTGGECNVEEFENETLALDWLLRYYL